MLALERPTVLRQLVLLAAIGVAFLRDRSSACSTSAGSSRSVSTGGSAPLRDRAGALTGDGCGRARSHCSRRVAFLGARLVGRLLASRLARRLLGALARLRPVRRREVDRVPPRRHRDLPRRDPARGRADRPDAARPARARRLRGRRPRSRRSSLPRTRPALLVVAAFTSTPWGYDRLHDRYAFYLLPLWLIVFVVWLADGLPRPLVAAAIGVVLALVLPRGSPVPAARERGRVSTPSRARSGSGSRPRWPAPARSPARVSWPRLVIALLLADAPPAAGARRSSASSPSSRVLLVTSALAWERLIDAPEDAVFAGGLERVVDRRSGSRGRGRDEAVPRHGVQLRTRAPCAVPHRGLQRDRRPRRVHRRLGSRRPADRARRRRLRRNAPRSHRATR